MKTNVVITLLNDTRVCTTLNSLENQSRLPDRVIIADGGSREPLPSYIKKHYNTVEFYSLPGSVASSRDDVLRFIDLTEDNIIIFIDADQKAPKYWLENLVAPIESGEADFTGGGTRPFPRKHNNLEKYVNKFDEWFYDNIVSNDITALPMGNSAWRADIFNTIGGFDNRLMWGGEDYDVNLRAISHGFKGKFVKSAWVWHDQQFSSIFKYLKKRYRYSVGATIAYIKNNVMSTKSKSAISKIQYRHPIEYVCTLLKIPAFLQGYRLWRRYYG